MSDIATQSDGLLLSIKRLAQEFGMARETVSKRIAGVAPAGKRAGHPVYRIKDVAEPIILGQASTNSANPEDWGPRDRLDHFRAENERLKFEETERTLIPAIEVETKMAELFKMLVLALETMPDVIERDVGLDGRQVRVMQRIIDGLRDSLYKALISSSEQQGIQENS